MIDLDLLAYRNLLQLEVKDQKQMVFDPIRKKWLVALPEELVRQLLVQYLIKERSYNAQRIAIERQLIVHEKIFRCDALIFDQGMQPQMLIECKAPTVKLTQAVFQQVANYNYPLQVPYLLITNGIAAYCCQLDHEHSQYKFLPAIPAFPQLSQPTSK